MAQLALVYSDAYNQEDVKSIRDKWFTDEPFYCPMLENYWYELSEIDRIVELDKLLNGPRTDNILIIFNESGVGQLLAAFLDKNNVVAFVGKYMAASDKLGTLGTDGDAIAKLIEAKEAKIFNYLYERYQLDRQILNPDDYEVETKMSVPEAK